MHITCMIYKRIWTLTNHNIAHQPCVQISGDILNTRTVVFLLNYLCDPLQFIYITTGTRGSHGTPIACKMPGYRQPGTIDWQVCCSTHSGRDKMKNAMATTFSNACFSWMKVTCNESPQNTSMPVPCVLYREQVEWNHNPLIKAKYIACTA